MKLLLPSTFKYVLYLDVLEVDRNPYYRHLELLELDQVSPRIMNFLLL